MSHCHCACVSNVFPVSVAGDESQSADSEDGEHSGRHDQTSEQRDLPEVRPDCGESDGHQDYHQRPRGTAGVLRTTEDSGSCHSIGKRIMIIIIITMFQLGTFLCFRTKSMNIYPGCSYI